MFNSKKQKYVFLSVFIMLVSLLPIYFFVLADNDVDPGQNKSKVSDLKITKIMDGTSSFDRVQYNSNNDLIAGNDINDHNRIVRNLDSVTYQLSYKFSLKNNSDDMALGENRTLILDVILPKDVEANVRYDTTSVFLSKTINIQDTCSSDSIVSSDYPGMLIFGGNYRFAEFRITNVSTSSDISRLSITLSDINASNNQVIEPIFILRESTDTDDNKKSLGNLSCEELSNINTLTNLLSNNSNAIAKTDDNTCAIEASEGEELNSSCSVKVTGKDNYFVRLFKGGSGKVGDDKFKTYYQIGVMVGLNNQAIYEYDGSGNIQTVYDGNRPLSKGIKGSLIPKEVRININPSQSDQYAYSDFNMYDSSLGLNVVLDDGSEMPEIFNGNTSINGNELKISNIRNIKNNVEVDNTTLLDYSYLSTNSLKLVYTRTDTNDYDDRVITITASDANDSSNQSSININNSYDYKLGSYESKIDFYDQLSNSQTENSASEPIPPKEYGKANFNYGQEFVINDSFRYSSGDELTSINHFVKIDNDAIQLFKKNGQDKVVVKLSNSDPDKNPTIRSTRYVFGKWTPNFFEPNLDGSSNGTCPWAGLDNEDALGVYNSLNKDELMNLYGGPCISLKAENSITGLIITENFDDTRIASLGYGPMIVQLELAGPKKSETEYSRIAPNSNAEIEFNARIMDNKNLVNKSFKVVSSASAIANNSSLVYMRSLDNSGNELFDGRVAISNKDNFSKTVYNFASQTVEALNNNLCNSQWCPISGNTILVSGIRVNVPTIESYFDDNSTKDFYYYPMELRINANAVINDSDAEFEYARIYVDIPNSLQVIKYGNNEITPVTQALPSNMYESGEYTRYIYTINADNSLFNINGGLANIKDFKVYTNIYLNTPDLFKPKIYVYTDFQSHLIEDRTQTFTSITPDSNRMRVLDDVVLHNSEKITTQGLTSPQNIEKNSSYTFNMRAFNNSSTVSSAYNYKNAGIYYVLPYNGDSSYSDLSSIVEANTNYVVSIDGTPDTTNFNYFVTKYSVPSKIISEEINDTSRVTWEPWDPTTPASGITAVKIAYKDNKDFVSGTYFGGENGITLKITPNNSKEGNRFYNNFYVIADRQNGEASSSSTKTYYSSGRSLASIYDRKVTGFVFEDYDYNGIFSENESKLSDIVVELYRVSSDLTNIDENDARTFIGSDDEKVAETLTDATGSYVFRGLSNGYYYVKFTFNDEKYNPTLKDVIDDNISNSSSNNSKSILIDNTNFAATNMISFREGSGLNRTGMNLGLSIKKQFAVDIKKYITKVSVTNSNGTKEYNYNNETRVKLEVANTNNTTVQVKYSFYVENTKYFPGYVGMIIDKMPAGMSFNPNLVENQNWGYYDGILYYTGLAEKILLPGEKQPFELVLDLNLTSGGTYTNNVVAKDLVLMGEEIPSYDFSTLNLYGPSDNTIPVGDEDGD